MKEEIKKNVEENVGEKTELNREENVGEKASLINDFLNLAYHIGLFPWGIMIIVFLIAGKQLNNYEVKNDYSGTYDDYDEEDIEFLSRIIGKSNCGIESAHAHLYINDEGYIRYIPEEYLEYGDYQRTNGYINIEGEEELYAFLDKNGLVRIEDNLDIISTQMEENKDYLEYEYSFINYEKKPIANIVGGVLHVSLVNMPFEDFAWTNNANHDNLTGRQRLCHYVYTGYKIEIDERGNYVLIPSEEVDDIREIADEFPYIKQDYYRIIKLNNGLLLEDQLMNEEDTQKNLDYNETNGDNEMILRKKFEN